MSLPRCILLVPCLALLGCGTGKDHPESATIAVLGSGKDHLDSATVAALESATRVEVFRIDSSPSTRQNRTAPGETRIGPYLVTAQGKEQGPAFAARLRDVLFDRKTYSNSKSECFSPGVVFRAWNGKESVDILLCFKCQNFKCLVAGGNSGRTKSFFLRRQT